MHFLQTRGRHPCRAQVYEDELTLAFMDLGQVNPGHVLVASKRHAVTLLELTAEEAGAVMQTAQRMAHAMPAAFDPDGITALQANGAAAEQTVRHFHMHVRAALPQAMAWPARLAAQRAWPRCALQDYAERPCAKCCQERVHDLNAARQPPRRTPAPKNAGDFFMRKKQSNMIKISKKYAKYHFLKRQETNMCNLFLSQSRPS